MSSAPSRSSADPLADALDAAADALVDAVRRVEAANPVVLVDGRSGAGKTTLASLLVDRWPLRGRVQSIALDALYPGWDGLEAGVAYALEKILVPHARGLVGVWQSWDWIEGCRGAAHAVDPALPLLVEGAGLLTPRTAKLGDVRVWVDAPAENRRMRALERDGDAYRPHWERWARQEDAHVAANAPSSHATLTIALP